MSYFALITSVCIALLHKSGKAQMREGAREGRVARSDERREQGERMLSEAKKNNQKFVFLRRKCKLEHFGMPVQLCGEFVCSSKHIIQQAVNVNKGLGWDGSLRELSFFC